MEEFTMAQQSKRDYLRSIYGRYASAARKEMAAILAEFCRVCGYHRKYAIWLLNRPLPEKARPRERALLKPSQLVGSPASHGQEPRRIAQPSASPWRGWTFSKKLKQEQQQRSRRIGQPFG